MKIRTAVALAVALASASGCERSPLLPDELRGTWVLEERASDGSRTEHTLVLDRRGRIGYDARSYGWYDLPDGVLTGYHRYSGTYRIDGERLMTRITRTETWALYAVGANPYVEHHRDARVHDAARVRLEEGRLVFTFVHAPLHVPEEVTIVFERRR
jgi:hypothetical protein